MSLRRKGIKDIFTELGKQPFFIWPSGKKGEGEHKSWWSNGQLWEHSFWKNGALHGERKTWEPSGELYTHSFWKDGNKIRDVRVIK